MRRKRNLLLLIVVLCLGSLGYALYSQYYNMVEPCPLCIAERIVIAFIGLLALVFAMHNPKGFVMQFYGTIIAILSLIGVVVAAHHVWIINLPLNEQPVSCGMPLDMLYKKLPLNSFIQYILRGDSECGKVNWTIFGVNAPTVVMILFIMIFILAIYLIFSKNKHSERRFY